jgi:hypothetical protein
MECLMLQEFNPQSKMRQAQAYIRGKQFNEAKAILETMDSPEARRLLQRVKAHLAGMDNLGSSPIQEQSLTALRYRRYWQVRILSYGVRFIALIWACLGLLALTVAPERLVMMGIFSPMVAVQEAALLIFGQVFFIYTGGAVLEMLADMATNQALVVAILNED